MECVHKSRKVIILTVKTQAASVFDEDEGHLRLLDIAARADSEEGIRQGLEDAMKGRIRPARTFFEAFEASHARLR
jgi:hypothetical protein